MTSVLLILILVSQFAILLGLKRILKNMDLSDEDAQVKAMTEQVAEAADKLPKTKQEK